MSDSIASILESFKHRNVARGQMYAVQGRVTELAETDDGVTAIVTGTERYEVVVRKTAKTARTLARCTCPAWQDDWQCKHIAAVAWALSARRKAPGATLQPLPDVFHSVYSIDTFFARVGLYLGKRVALRADQSWEPLTDWWWGAIHGSSMAARALAQHVVDLAPEIDAALAALRAWRAPPLPRTESTAYSELYDALAKIYEERSRTVKIGSALPGPLDDGRHPGFTFAWHLDCRSLQLEEKPSPLLEEDEQRRLEVVIPLDAPGEKVRFEGHAFADHGATDAWDLFALRSLLFALHARAEPAVLELARELDRPIWEVILHRIAAQQGTDEPPREWRFTIVSSPHRGYDLMEIIAYARDVATGTKARWKRQPFQKLLAEKASPLEHEIARLAVRDRTFQPGRGGPPESYLFRLGTPLSHELLRLLARHPRVLFSDTVRGSPDKDPPAEISAGVLSMTLDRGPGAVLTPRFRVDGEPLRVPLASLEGDRASLHRHLVTETGVLSIEVPAPLRPWLEMSAKLGRALAFPPEAVPKLASVTQPLMQAGIVELPRAALGDELPYEPVAALRVEWRPDRSEIEAIVEVMIRAHPRAPFAPAGRGPVLFTFEDGDARVYVERDLGRELHIAGETLDAIDVDGIAWESGVGRTRDIEEAIALAAWLDRNPLGLPIEVKVGRPPAVRPLPRNTSVVVRKAGAWLRVDGSFEEAGKKITLGEMLEAARLAQRYLRAGDGVFYELTQEAMAKLRPIALAAQLAPKEAEVGSTILHDGFGALLAQAADLFDSVQGEGIDLREYVTRFERRDRRVKVPPLDHGTLRDYQREGVAWMLRLASWAPGCVLADDMGLGKTVQTAAVLKARAKLGPALIVAPASVSSNWVSELGRFVPSLNVRWYNEDRAAPLADLGAGDVLVVSYGLLQRESAAFREQHWTTVVVDEAQYVKNIEAQRSDAVRSLPRDFTVALTGTPLENHLGELFSIVDIAFPGLLGDERAFREHFRRPIESSRNEDRLAALGALIGPFLLRRTRASVLAELPPREDITEQIDLSLAERKRYLALRNECAKALERQRGEKTPPSQLRIALLAALTRLRQMACDVRLVDPEFDGPSTKITRAVELARQITAEGSRVLVFSQFTQFLDKVRAALEEAGLRVAMLTGETPTTDRRPIIDAFQAGEHDVFCVSLLAGGTGLNLTRASYVIHLDPWWNPAAEEQATARAHRMGQTNPVTVYRLVSRGTIEQAVLEMHADKRQLASAVLEGRGTPKAITSAELLELVRFGG